MKRILKTPVVVLKWDETEDSKFEQELKSREIVFTTHHLSQKDTKPEWLSKLCQQPVVKMPLLFIEGKF